VGEIDDGSRQMPSMLERDGKYPEMGDPLNKPYLTAKYFRKEF
jgi:hypothetical protein